VAYLTTVNEMKNLKRLITPYKLSDVFILTVFIRSSRETFECPYQRTDYAVTFKSRFSGDWTMQHSTYRRWKDLSGLENAIGSGAKVFNYGRWLELLFYTTTAGSFLTLLWPTISFKKGNPLIHSPKSVVLSQIET